MYQPYFQIEITSCIKPDPSCTFTRTQILKPLHMYTVVTNLHRPASFHLILELWIESKKGTSVKYETQKQVHYDSHVLCLWIFVCTLFSFFPIMWCPCTYAVHCLLKKIQETKIGCW